MSHRNLKPSCIHREEQQCCGRYGEDGTRGLIEQDMQKTEGGDRSDSSIRTDYGHGAQEDVKKDERKNFEQNESPLCEIPEPLQHVIDPAK